MAWRRLLALALLTVPLAGCLGGSTPQGLDPLPEDPEPAPIDDPPRRSPPPSPPSSRPAPPPSPSPAPSPPPPLDPGPQVVIAHIDSGINPYHRTFLDPSPLAQVHPSTYLPGFPADAPALRLSLDAPTYEDALLRDEALWAGVEAGRLYWIPGTRIVGAIRFEPGGADCPQEPLAAPTLPAPLPAVPVLPQEVVCPDRPIVDEHGHGTMTASRMAGASESLCPACRIVSIEGLGPVGVQWAADQGWIDVQTNSWGSLLPATAPGLTGDIRHAFASAAQRMLVFAASGNGLGFQGVVGEPTWQQSTASLGVLQVGAHDNARMTLYQGIPPHVVADGYGGWRANARHLDESSPSGETCCTSAASPYAAGGAAAMLLEARRALGHRGTGFREGVGASGSAFGAGPLGDGVLALDELKRIVLTTAQPRPVEGIHDGLMHWAGHGAATQPPAAPPDPGWVSGNPYCPGCWALPAKWSDIPREAPAWPLIGYGAVDPTSLDLALRVLRGEGAMPLRPDEDQFFSVDATVRGAIDQLPP